MLRYLRRTRCAEHCCQSHCSASRLFVLVFGCMLYPCFALKRSIGASGSTGSSVRQMEGRLRLCVSGMAEPLYSGNMMFVFFNKRGLSDPKEAYSYVKWPHTGEKTVKWRVALFQHHRHGQRPAPTPPITAACCLLFMELRESNDLKILPDVLCIFL